MKTVPSDCSGMVEAVTLWFWWWPCSPWPPAPQEEQQPDLRVSCRENTRPPVKSPVKKTGPISAQLARSHTFIEIQRTEKHIKLHQFSSVQSLSRVWLFAIPWTTAHQASLSITNSQSPPKPMSIESVMPSNYLVLSSPSPPAPNLSQHQGLFKWVSSWHQVAKVLELQLQNQSFQWTPRTDLL